MAQRKAAKSPARKRSPETDFERGFRFLKTNQREGKPRSVGITEIRGPYYSVMGRRYLEDVLETMGPYVDALKFAGGSFSLMPRNAVEELIETCHDTTCWSRPAASWNTC